MTISMAFPDGAINDGTIAKLRDALGEYKMEVMHEWQFPIADCVVSIKVTSANTVDIGRMAQYAIDMLTVVAKCESQKPPLSHMMKPRDD